MNNKSYKNMFFIFEHCQIIHSKWNIILIFENEFKVESNFIEIFFTFMTPPIKQILCYVLITKMLKYRISIVVNISLFENQLFWLENWNFFVSGKFGINVKWPFRYLHNFYNSNIPTFVKFFLRFELFLSTLKKKKWQKFNAVFRLKLFLYYNWYWILKRTYNCLLKAQTNQHARICEQLWKQK